MLLKFNRYFALIWAIVLAIVEAFAAVRTHKFWPFWFVDYIAVVLLVYGFIRSKETHRFYYLTVAWAFTTSFLYMKYFVRLEQVIKHETSQGVFGLGAFLLVSIIGLVTAFMIRENK